MKFQTKYKILLVKSYFDQGLSLTNYFKYLIGFFALASRDVKNTFLLVGAYILFCWILGFLWFKYNWIEAQQEVSNKYNIFVKEVRNHLKGGKKRNGKRI